MIKLLVKFGDESREVEIKETDISIGRSTDNVLPLGDKKSSRKHATIQKVGDEYRINDLGSGNGTKVNGRDVNTHVLAKGDEIVIGLTTMFVLSMDTPAKPVAASPSPAALAATVPASAGIAPAAPKTEDRPAENMADARRKHTRRGTYARKSGSWVGTAVAVAVLLAVAGVGYYFYLQHEKEAVAKRDAKMDLERQSSAKVREAQAEYNKFKARAAADPVEDSIIAEATALAQTYGATYPEFDTLVSQLKQRRAEQIGRDDFATVDSRVQGALKDRRFGDALEALKDMKSGINPAMSSGLVTKVCDSINVEFKSIDDYGRKLSDEKKYSMAADHYRLQAPRFKGTEHFKYLMYKPETLELLNKTETETATAKGNRPAEPADTALAKVDPPAPKETPKPSEPAAMTPPPAAMPKEMAKEMPKPAPAMPKETPKPATPKPPPPPPPPAPATPKEPEKKPEEGAKTAFKKPDGPLCDCKKIAKGMFCVKCDRMLVTEDMRNGVCKRCEEKPKKIDLCVKKYFMVDGDPASKSEKPILKDGKLYDFPYEDKARIVYLCEACGESNDSQYDVKHKPDCSSKTAIKVCSKSGTPPHGGDKK
jgi:hypothetical protein